MISYLKLSGTLGMLTKDAFTSSKVENRVSWGSDPGFMDKRGDFFRNFMNDARGCCVGFAL